MISHNTMQWQFVNQQLSCTFKEKVRKNKNVISKLTEGKDYKWMSCWPKMCSGIIQNFFKAQ